jgi:hypothetical protein
LSFVRADLRCAIVLAIAAGCGAPAAEPVPVLGDPGRVVARRLGRTAYDRTVRDLLGTERRFAHEFPADDPSAGFDDLAGVLATSPLQVELYERAAARLGAEAATPGTAAHARVVVCDPSVDGERECFGEVARTLAPRAWRRPVDDDELAALDGLLDAAHGQGGDFHDAVDLLVRATTMSPSFLFRIERDPGARAAALTPWEQATRLSYFLWGSMPDDELFAAADAGALATDEEIEAEALRMLADPRADALVDDFAGQWLPIRALGNVFKDTHLFPQWDAELRASMEQELRHDLAAAIAEDLDVRELLTGTTTFVDARLAAHYGLAVGPAPDEGFVEVDLAPLGRVGLLSRGGVLAVLAHPFTTSPTRRGAWVLDALLCRPIPSPPADVDAAPIHGAGTSKRDLLAAHAADPACASCHAQMDPIGLALEHYDAIGRWRFEDGGVEIDTAGELSGGRAFADLGELAQLLADDEAFPRCVARKALTYGTGRVLGAADEVHLDAVVDEWLAAGAGLRTLFVLVARSEPMRFRAPLPEASP